MLLTAVTKFGDVFNTGVAQVLSDLGWRPEMIGYGGLGSTQRVRVIARVLMAPTPFEEKYERWARRRGAPTLADLDAAADRARGRVGEVIRDAVGHASADETPTTAQTRGERGWRQFVDAQIPFQPVLVQVGSARKVIRADRGGYVDITLENHGLEPGWHAATVQALESKAVARGDKRVRASRPISVPVRIVGADENYGLVSDVDDTVMVSWLPRPVVAWKNAFVAYVSSRQAVPGMSLFLRALARDYTVREPGISAGHRMVATVYLSTGAWNVAPSLRRFLSRTGFPTGTPLMTDWGPSQTGWFRSGQEHKRRELRRLADAFPWVKWILVGDDGQHDPSIYTEFAEEYPENVAAICLRTLTTREQVLSHGAPDPREHIDRLTKRIPEQIPVIVGEDGYDLTRAAQRTHIL